MSKSFTLIEQKVEDVSSEPHYMKTDRLSTRATGVTGKHKMTGSEPDLAGIKRHKPLPSLTTCSSKHQSIKEIQASPEATEKAQVPFLYQNVLEYDNKRLEYTIEDHDITLRIPEKAILEKAIPEGEKVHIEIGVAAYGPFISPKNTQPISPIVWLCIQEKDIELQKPFQLVLPHYLTGLTNERIRYHQVKFVKAIHNDDTSDEQRGLYKFDFRDPDPLFASTGDKSYGVLESTHFCYYCLVAGETPELGNDASYCLTRIERPSLAHSQKTEVYFCATYYLKTRCITALREQLPPEEGYRISRLDRFKFSGRCTGLTFTHSRPCPPEVQCVVGFEPTRARIKKADINFWNLSEREMEWKHEMKIYPPRVKMTVTTSDPSRPFIIPVKVTGCLSTDQLDMDITFPLENSQASSAPEFENQSQTKHTFDSTPSLKDAFTKLLNIASQWKTIGILLGLDLNLLQTIKSGNNSDDDCLGEMLGKWLNHIDEPTWRCLLNAVKKVNRAKADEIIRNDIAT